MDESESARRKKPPASKRKPKQTVKFKKAPQAPRRFKSAYMFFSTDRHREIRARLKAEGNVTEKTTNIAKMVSREWKALSPEERDKWEEIARRDKARYEMEKSMYTGPWKVPAKMRNQKDPAAPKRPMSAFLSFSNSRRAEMKRANPHCTNAEISKKLADLWKDASEEERKEHVEKEFELRKQYKAASAAWKKQQKESSASAAYDHEHGASVPHRQGMAMPVGDFTHSHTGGYYPPYPGGGNQGFMPYHHASAGTADQNDREGMTSYPTEAPSSYGNPEAGMGYYQHQQYQQGQYAYPNSYDASMQAQPQQKYGDPSSFGPGYSQYPPQQTYGYYQQQQHPYDSGGGVQMGQEGSAEASYQNANMQSYMMQQQGAAPYHSGYGGSYNGVQEGDEADTAEQGGMIPYPRYR